MAAVYGSIYKLSPLHLGVCNNELCSQLTVDCRYGNSLVGAGVRLLGRAASEKSNFSSRKRDIIIMRYMIMKLLSGANQTELLKVN